MLQVAPAVAAQLCVHGVAVFGLGAVGLAVIEAAKRAGEAAVRVCYKNDRVNNASGG
jgi:Zn-dependent alcohol dehydrogenase